MTQFFSEQKHKVPRYLAMPIFLLQDEPYKGLSCEAKLLYSAMLWRVDISRKNKWMDDLGRVYQFYPVTEAMALLGCCKQKALNTFRELQAVDLLERENQGQGKPSRILLKIPHVGSSIDHKRSDYDSILDLPFAP